MVGGTCIPRFAERGFENVADINPESMPNCYVDDKFRDQDLIRNKNKNGSNGTQIESLSMAPF